MAIVKSGIALGFSGKVGNLIFSQQANGTTTVSGIGKVRTTPFTANEIANHQCTSVCNQFIKPIKDFISVGYELEAKRKGQNQHNVMVTDLKQNSLIKDYPNTRIDFSKVLVTKGSMLPPENAAVSINEFGLGFTWDTEITVDGMHYSDQVMTLAYFPTLGKARFMTGGAQRNIGKDMLVLSGIEQGNMAEIYISLIKANRKEISNSVYLGQLIW